MQQSEAQIYINDTIKAIGLKYLLKEYFSINASIMDGRFAPEINEDSILFFISPEFYISNQDFFIPRRSRTIIITDKPSTDFNTLSSDLDETSVIERLTHILDSLSESNKEKKQSNLSQREIDVLKLVAKGLINKEIAEMLSISFNTVLTHRKNITAKLGIKSVSGLGFYAIMNGYISESDLKH